METSSDKSHISVGNSIELFKNKSFLETLATPHGAKLVGRDGEMALLFNFLSPSQNRGLIVPFISVHGKSGTGKSAAVETVCKSLERDGLLNYRFVNLRRARTVFGCANTILHAIGETPLKSADGMSVALERIELAIKGIAENRGQNHKDKKNSVFVLVIDEFDALFSHGKRNDSSDFIFNLMLIEEELRKQGIGMCTIAISNKVVSDYSLLDDRVRSRIGSSMIYFPSYRMKQLAEILQDRQVQAFSNPVDPDVLEYCAMLSSRNHGDARRAIDLLRRSGEVALSRYENGVTIQDSTVKIEKQDVDTAFSETQGDAIADIVKSLPAQLVFVIAAMARLDYLTDGKWHSTSILLEQYLNAVKGQKSEEGFKPLSRRRFAEALTELENIGFVESIRTSLGRHGYHARYRLLEDPKTIGETCFGGKWWQEILDLKERRNEFLTGKSFGKALEKFEKKKKKWPNTDDTVLTEMNDHVWTTMVYGRSIVRE